ncbi:hypothetical protein [Arthrobacter sp. efr-133-TYG-118]|uniref:hypothetical protein n=1 Tax=Arthrobacter sp. efr-133-TYG-118 TaxID=3040279 RepID=UPI0025514A55|nr:hypothetical protein [Arthrobacter sp. efr-133-TYG-118]
MSTTTVIAQIQSFLAPTPGLTVLFKDVPWQMTGENWQTNSMPGTAAFLHIEHITESRIAQGGEHGGWKQRDYQVALVVLYQYLIPSDVASKDVWVDGRNALIDAITTRIESDRAFGSVGGFPVWEAGNQDNGIEVNLDFPVWDKGGGKVRNWFRVEFKVTEMVPA